MSRVLERLISDAEEASAGADWRGLLMILRRTRARAALYIALADLGGAWEFGQVTAALTSLADRLTGISLRWLVADEIAKNRMPGMGQQDIPDCAGISVSAWESLAHGS